MAPLVDIPGDSARALAQAEAYLGYDDVGWFLLGAAGVGAALMIVPASLAAIRAGLPPGSAGSACVAGILSGTRRVPGDVRLDGVDRRRRSCAGARRA